MGAVITVLEARVDEERVQDLVSAYQAGAATLDPGIIGTDLMRDARQPDQWRIVTRWQSMETLQAMRARGGTPKGIQFFRAAGAEPQLSIFEVVSSGGA